MPRWRAISGFVSIGLFTSLAIACGSSDKGPITQHRTHTADDEREFPKIELVTRPSLSEDTEEVPLGCDAEGDEGCNALDDDCDGKIDEGCGYEGGPLQVTVAWNNDADLDLFVIDPKGERISFHQPTGVNGTYLRHSGRGGCERSQANRSSESVQWQQPPQGRYQVLLHYWGECGSNAGRTTATISIAAQERVFGPYNISLPPGAKRDVLTFDLRHLKTKN